MALKNTKQSIFQIPTQKKAALYVRVSTKYQVDKDSLPFQKKKLKEYCTFLGIEDYIVFEDDGYSAKNTDRPKFQEMMHRIRSGEFSHLLVWKVDRISRNLLDFSAMYKELKDHRVTFISLNEQFDTSTAIGEAMLKIILVFAELERNMTAERVTGIMLDRAEQGLWNGARMPVGYRWNPEKKFPEPDPDELKTVQLIFNKYEEWRSCQKISRFLNKNHYKTKRGGEWTSKLIHDIIRNPFYIGTYRYNLRESGRGPLKPESEWIVRENNHPGIIELTQFHRCNAIMDKNGTTRDTSNLRERKYVHTFSGHLICGECGANMIATKDRPRKNGWRPSVYRCGRRSRMMDCNNSSTISETYVGPFIFNYISNLTKLQNNIEKITNINNLEKELLKGTLFKDIIRIGTQGLESTLQALLYNHVENGAYSPDILLKSDSNDDTVPMQIESLNTEINKSKTAIQRLTDIYLYDPFAMSKDEFISKRKELSRKIEEMEQQLSMILRKNDNIGVTDLSFVKKASAFLVAQKIVSRDHVDYIQMATDLDNEILKDFVDQTIDKIIVKSGRIEAICFINGLRHDFIYKSSAEIKTCKKCGGRIGTTRGCRTRTFDYNGKKYRRIKVGDPGDDLMNKKNAVCPECGAQANTWHHWECELERCPICGDYLVKCPHGNR